MPVRLRPMRDDELPDYLVAAEAAYVDDLVRNGGMPVAQARRKAAGVDDELLAQGVATPGQHLSCIEDAADGRRVGVLWFGELDRNGTPTAFLYDIEIEPADRGRGYGREAMAAFEAAARACGCVDLVLNVFAGNAAARALYGSLGYGEHALTMTKPLA